MTLQQANAQHLAERLAGASGEERNALFRAHEAFLDASLAHALKVLCYATWASDPPRAIGAADALADLAALRPEPEICALAEWTAGIADLVRGAMETATGHLDAAAAMFTHLNDHHTATSTQISKLIALALLGRYAEAVACGLQARDTFLALGDECAAGKVEQNLGNIAWRRDDYREAEQFHRLARERFARAGDVELLVAAENALAMDLAAQFRLHEAADRYAHALKRAEEAGLELRQAEIEANLGNLALAQGRYDQALDYLERSRRRYAALGMPHESACAEQELAEAYLDLNMAPEAAAIYARITPVFAALGMRAEQAWALAHYGQAAVLLSQYDDAQARFATARQLFLEEGNTLSAALVTLFEAHLAYRRGEYVASLEQARSCAAVFASAGNYGRALLARWLQGEALRALGRYHKARAVLLAVDHEAGWHNVPQIAQRAQASLGLLAAATGDRAQAEAALRRAVTLIETLRAPLPSEELRTAFVADKLGPYDALMRLYLQDTPPRPGEALACAEGARARALAEVIGRAVQTLAHPRDAFEARLLSQMSRLREELNWLYTRLNRLVATDEPSPSFQDNLQAAIHAREVAILDLNRQLHLRGGMAPGAVAPFDLSALQQALGADTALVEYHSLDGQIIAFIVTDTTVEAVQELGSEGQVETLVARLRFQIEAPRRGIAIDSAHGEQALRRVRHYLERLHCLLLAPLESRLGARRLVIAPHRALHYVPFHALYDGTHYVIEHREVCTVPSAAVLQHCLTRPRHAYERAVLVGYADQRAPRVRDEVRSLAPLFPQSVVLLDHGAHSAEVRRHAPDADVLHLACHGVFRPDNPLFSALHLADGRFTTRDAYGLTLQCELVTLSACETGVSTIAPGDELIGLSRGFFAAGAPGLLVSLWTVDDASTADLMRHFYLHLRMGGAPAAALRSAQRALLARRPHPFFWAAFVLMGRW